MTSNNPAERSPNIFDEAGNAPSLPSWLAALAGRHRWLTVVAIIVLLAALTGVGTALQGTESGDSSSAAPSIGIDSSEAEIGSRAPNSDTTAGVLPETGAGKAAGSAAIVAPSEVSGTATDAPGVVADGSGEAGADIAPMETPQVAGVERDLVRTATLDLTTKEPDTASAKARSIVTALGGRVAQEQSSFSGNSTVVLTLALPPKGFDRAMEQLSGLGKVTDRSQSTDDVTGQVTDLEGRITTLKASIVRLQGFLSKASDAGEIGTLESELLRRETELEGIQGQLRTIEAQVAESTVTLTITEPGTRIEPIEETDDGVGFMDGLTRGWEAFTAVVNAIVVALAAIAPFFGIGLLVWLVVRVARRRRGAADADSSTADAAPSDD